MSAITRAANRAVLKLSKHSPKILFGAGIAGMVGTVVVASRAAIKAQPIMQSAHDRLEHAEKAISLNGPEVHKKVVVSVYQDTAIELGKIYAPVVVLGGLSIVCLTKSHQILTNRNVALTAAYAGIDKAFREYRERVVAELGQEKDYEFAHKMTAKDIVEYDAEGNPVIKEQKKVSKDAQHIYGRLFARSTTRYWEKPNGYNCTFLDSNLKYANYLLKQKGHLFLNEVYDMLGYDRTPEGALVGWLYNGSKDTDGYVDFGFYSNTDFMAGFEPDVFLDFNVDGIIYDQI